MAVVYVEARPKGAGPVTHFVVEDHADNVLAVRDMQEDAILWAKKDGHSPHVARVRHLSDKKKPDHWRAV